MKIETNLPLISLCSTLLIGVTSFTSQPAEAQIDPLLGEIVMFGGNFAPRGWAFTDGQLLPISVNSALFSILGTTYGGDGRTTFALPDLRGRVPMHAGRGPGLTERRLGERGGVEAVTLNTSQIPSHTHTASSIATTTSVLKATSTSGNTNIPTGNVLADDGSDRIYKAIAPDVSMSAAAIESTTDVTTTVNATGGSQPHTNVQPYQVVNFIIATQGIFPSRN